MKPERWFYHDAAQIHSKDDRTVISGRFFASPEYFGPHLTKAFGLLRNTVFLFDFLFPRSR